MIPITVAIILIITGCVSFRQWIVGVMSSNNDPEKFVVEGDPAGFAPTFEGKDADRPKIKVTLTKVAANLTLPTDFQFVPGSTRHLVIAEKLGALKLITLGKDQQHTLLKLEVLDSSEQGLLGFAFHPNFLKNGRLFTNATVKSGDFDVTRIQEWNVESAQQLALGNASPLKPSPIILDIKQPYANHNGGQILFGPDGYLYIGMGDGGWRGDPDDNAQDPHTPLGAMLRIDVDHPKVGRFYGIPKDNPFVGKGDGFREEIFALGLRNPWRFTFDTKGRLVAGDVGQDQWEEITFVPKGANLGWSIREGRHCYEPAKDCAHKGLMDPVVEHAREEAKSITGGVVCTGSRVGALKGKYVYGDFAMGRLWSVNLPADESIKIISEDVFALGHWPMAPVSFARDQDGDCYVADFGSGTIYRFDN